MIVEPTAEVRVLPNAGELSRAAAEEFVCRATESVLKKDLFSVVLSGGSTPLGLYSLLANPADSFRARMPWLKTHFFWGDERNVPPDHPESNFRMANEMMLSKVGIEPANVHRMKTEVTDAGEVARDYEQSLRRFFQCGQDRLPRFDLVLLGLGADGHTASLFPGSAVLGEQSRLVAEAWIEDLNSFRVTLTPPVLNSAACVIFLVIGSDKREILRDVLKGGYRPKRLPAQLVRPTEGDLLWLVDEAAASLLNDSRRT